MKAFITIVFCCLSFFVSSQVSYTWTGASSSAWGLASNWSPAGVPAPADYVTIVTGANPCVIAANTNITNLTITSGTLNLGGFTLNSSGITAFNGGNCINGNFTTPGSSLTFAGTVMGANVTANVTDVYFNGSTFNGNVNITRNNSTNIQSSGNNIFNGTASITNAGAGYLLLTNNSSKTEAFNGAVTFNVSGAGNLYVAYNGNATFASSLTINNTANNGSIYLGNTGKVTMTSGNAISMGSFAGGMLYLNKFSQTTPVAQTLSPGPNGGVAVNSSTISAAFTVNAGNIYTSNSIYSAPVTFNKSGGTNNASSGGNTFNSTLTMNHTGAGYWSMGNGSADIFNGDLYLNNTCNNERIIIGHNSSNNQLNGNVYVTQSGTAQGIDVGFGGTAPVVTFAASKTVIIGGAGFSAGYLKIYRLSQLSATALNIVTTGTSRVILQDNTLIGSVDITTPDIYPYGGTYNAPVHFLKTGGTTGNHNAGYLNIFNSTLNLENQSGTGYILLGYNSADQFNDNVTVSSTGAGGISFGWSGNTGTPVLASGKTISVGPSGFNAGYLQLGGFTQLGATPLNLTLTGSAYFQVINNSNPCVFNAAVNVTAPDVYIQGGTFNGPASFTKTGGSGSNHNNQQQNIFNSTCTINQQSSSGYFMLGYNSNDLFNDNIIVTSSGSGGIYLGWTSGTGTPTLASGKTILVGGAGFNAGFLYLNTFTQLGNAPMNLNFTGTTAYLAFARNTVIGGNLTSSTPGLYFHGATFNGTVNSVKTGPSNDAGAGGNIFNAVSSFTNTGAGYLMFGNVSPDTWNADVSFVNAGSERILPCWNSTGNLFNGNISVSSTSGIGINFCGNAFATATVAATKTIVTGPAGYSAGYLILQRFTQLGSAPVTLSLTPTSNYLTIGPNSTIGGNLTGVAPSINNVVQSVFNGTVDLTKTGSSGDPWQGGNTYNSTGAFTNTGSGYMGMGWTYPDIFNGDVTFTDLGTERILPAWSSAGNQFNGNITVNSTGGATGIQFCGSTGSATLAATKTVSVGVTGFSAGYLILKGFTQLGNAPVNLTLSAGSNYLQYGPGSLLGGNVTSVSPGLYFHGCTFNGTATCTKNGSTNDQSNGSNVFNATTVMNNTGSGYLLFGNAGYDQFNTTTTFNNLGSSHIYVAYNSTNNIFGGQVTFNNSPTSTNSWIYVASYMANNSIFNGNVIVTCNNGAGVSFGNNGGTSTLSAGQTMSIGSSGFNAGSLIIKNFTQVGSGTPHSFTTTGTSNIQYGPGSSFDASVTSLSPGLYFHGCTFNSAATCTKNGTTNDQSNGSNIFNGTTVMNNAGSGYLLFGNSTNDQFNTTTTFNNLGSSHIYVAYNSANNIFGGQVTFNNSPAATNSWIYVASYLANNSTFNGNIIVNCNNGGGVYFGNNGGTTTLSAGRTITVGAGGFNAGGFIMKNFTQVGNTAQSFTTTGSSYIQYGPSSSFDGDVTSVSPGLLFHGCTYNRTATCTKNGPTSDQSNGSNIFNGTTVMNNTGSGYLLFGNSTNDQFNTTTTFNNLGSSHIYVAYNSANNIFGGNVTFNNSPTSTSSWIYVSNYLANNATFNGNIIVNCVNGAGVSFCNSSGTATLSAGKTISVGAPGFNAGQLILKSFTQLGATAQSITTTGSSQIQFGPSSTFNGDVTSLSPSVLFNTTTFNGMLSSTKNGTPNDNSGGGNIFNGATTLTDVGTGNLLMANSLSDAYNADVTFVQNSTGIVYPNYNTNCTYAGNITISSTSTPTITFGASTNGIATLTGGNAQTINKTGTVGNPVFTRLVLNKSANAVTLNTRINVSSYFTPTSGLMNTTQANILNMNNNTTTTIGNASSYVVGPMNYDMAVNGSRTLNFPIGKAADWRPVVLGLTHSNSTSYTYNSELFIFNASALGWAYPPTINNVSHVHYWDILRTVTGSATSTPTAGLSGNQVITIYFDTNDGVVDGSTLTIAKNTYTAPAAWIDIGGTGAPAYAGGANLTGSVTSTSAPSAFNSFSRFTLANRIGGIYNPLPIELLSFDAKPEESKVRVSWSTSTETNNDHFEVERSQDGSAFEYAGTVSAHGNGNSLVKQDYTFLDAKPYSGLSYYRLKQVDKSQAYKYSNIVSVSFDGRTVHVYPNPTTDKIWISTSVKTTVKVVDQFGQEIIREYALSSSKESVDLSHLAPGVYFVILNDGAEEPTRTRIVVQ